MQFKSFFKSPGVWLKGNTHAHSTESDGKLTPEELSHEYGKRGYDFLFLTDHWKRTVAPTLPKGPLMIPATEINLTIRDSSYHVVCLGIKKEWKRRKFRSLGELARLAESQNVMLVMAHPYWCGLPSTNLIKAPEFVGLEVYNTCCDINIGKGYSAVHWDDVLASGKHVLGLAVDDVHHPKHLGKGWIMVRARKNTPAAILDAIKRGRFYSTQGPQIHDIRIERGSISISCSPVRRINLICRRSRGASCISDKDMTTFKRELPRDPGYLRVECIDAKGNIAWSNPFWL